jgi:isopenicillin-N N-acyltransferase-like protein
MPQAFPYLEVSGTYREVGLAIGNKFRDKIQSRIKFRRQVVKEYEVYLGQIRPYLEESIKAFPQFVQELKAIAEGAQVSFEDYFLNNTYEIHDFDFAEFEEGHCTIAVSFTSQGAIIGHNEDWPAEASAINDLYILKVTTGETTYLGLQYATDIPGVGASINNWGLVQCINSLYTSKKKIGVPKNFLSRAILECKTLDEAEMLVKNTNRASGYNHVLVQNHEMRNIEIAGDAVAVEKSTTDPYVHTNHYLAPEMQIYEEEKSKSSPARYARARELIKNNMIRNDMAKLLSDTANDQYPICNKGTIASVIIIPYQKEVWVCYGQLKGREFVKYTL